MAEKKPASKKAATRKKVVRKKTKCKKKPMEIVGQLMPKAGQPTKYHPDLNYTAYKMALVGMTDVQIAQVFNISDSTFDNWKIKYPEFLGSLRKGKAPIDGDVAEKLLHRALGYTHQEEKVFCSQGEIVTHITQKHYPPDTQAALAWLRNRQPELWRDKLEVETKRPLQEYTIEELRALQRRLMRERKALGVDEEEI